MVEISWTFSEEFVYGWKEVKSELNRVRRVLAWLDKKNLNKPDVSVDFAGAYRKIYLLNQPCKISKFVHLRSKAANNNKLNVATNNTLVWKIAY